MRWPASLFLELIALSVRERGDFKVYAELEAFEKADDPDGNVMRIGGVCTTDRLDKQDERVVAEGLDFSPFLAEGWYNDNHGRRTIDVVGYPSDARYVTKGTILPTGKKAKRNGWWTEGYLLNTEEGRRLFALTQALAKSPRKLGFSIEGKVVERDKRNRTVVTRARVKNVAVTHCPVNTDTEMHALVKALTAGAAIDSGDLNQGPGDGGALRVESLEGPPSDQGGRKAKQDDDDPEIEHLTEGGDGGEADNGGLAGESMHKAEDEFELEPITETDSLREWAPHLALMSTPQPVKLSKAEARIVIRDRFPLLPESEVDRIIRHARNA